MYFRCFYLSNRRKIQLVGVYLIIYGVVFTFQTEGRYNLMRFIKRDPHVVFTFQTEGRYNLSAMFDMSEKVVFTFQTEGRYNIPNLTV